MTSRARLAALRIASLLEEFSATEVMDAVEILGSLKNEDLLSFLRRSATVEHEAKTLRGRNPGMHGGSPSLRVLEGLREIDPEKYEVLTAFAVRMREGAVLLTIEDIRRFGAILVKDFRPGKSRKDAIGKLLTVLAGMEVKAIRSALEKAPASTAQDDSFQRLANHIIGGGPVGPSRP